MTIATRPVDLDAVEREAGDRIRELHGRRQQLALDALKSKRAAGELEDVERRLQSAETELQRVALARGEQGRRDREAREAAAAQARDEALSQARAAAVDRAKAASAINTAAAALGQAIAAHKHADERLRESLRAAGRFVPAATSPERRTRAVAFGLSQAGVRRALELPPVVKPAPMDEQRWDIAETAEPVAPPPRVPQTLRGLNAKANSREEEYAYLVERYGREGGRKKWMEGYGYGPADLWLEERFDRWDRLIERAANAKGEKDG